MEMTKDKTKEKMLEPAMEDIPLGSLDKNKDQYLIDDSQMYTKIQSFEDLMELAGTSGRWNIMIFVLGCYCTFMNPLQLISYEFLGATPDHTCKVETLEQANWTEQQILDLAIPKKNDSHQIEYEGCQMYDYNYTLAVELGFEAALKNLDVISRGNPDARTHCYSRVFNHTQYTSTVVTEWDLVCERRALYSTTQAVSQLGTLIGYLILGVLLDHFGRRRVVLAGVFLGLLSGFGAAAANSFELYAILRIIISCVIAGFYMGCFVIVMELCTPSQRSSVGSMYVVPWALGYMTVPGIAYLVREWRWLQVAYTLPITTLLIYIWILPESPRWLISKERYQEALDVFSYIAKVNGRTLPSSTTMLATMEKIRKQQDTSSEEVTTERSIMGRITKSLTSLVSLISNRNFRMKTIISFIAWNVIAMVYYGLSLNSTNLSADPYLYVFLGGAVEVPSYILLWPAIAYLGRKSTLISLQLLCAICISVIATMMYLELNVPVYVMVILSLSGKMAVTAAFHLLFVYTAELFPTRFRSLALGQANVCARIGSISSPYINDILGLVVEWGPSALFASVSVGVAGLTLLLPETKGTQLTEGEDSDDSDPETRSGHTAKYEVNKGFDPS